MKNKIRDENDELLNMVPPAYTKTFENKHLDGRTLRQLNESARRFENCTVLLLRVYISMITLGSINMVAFMGFALSHKPSSMLVMCIPLVR